MVCTKFVANMIGYPRAHAVTCERAPLLAVLASVYSDLRRCFALWLATNGRIRPSRMQEHCAPILGVSELRCAAKAVASKHSVLGDNAQATGC
jgi:hypothetical protein